MAFSTQLRPTLLPEWASGVSGAARIVEPTQTEKNLGWQASQIPPSTYFNWFMNGVYQWMKYLDGVRGAAFVGDQSDGDLFLTGATRYVLQKHGNFRDIAIGPSGILDANGWGVRARVITGVSGVVQSVGGNGGTGVTAYPFISALFSYKALRGVPGAGPFAGAYGEGTGYIATGAPGGTWDYLNNIRNALGGGGGTGGLWLAGSDAGGNQPGGTCVSPSGFWSDLNTLINGVVAWSAQQSGPSGFPPYLGVTHSYLRGGAGGAHGSNQAGGPSGYAGGGGGGAGGSYLPIVCEEWNLQGVVSVRGGDGGWGYFDPTMLAGYPGGGGGGGGGGGKIALAYGRKRVDPSYDYRGGTGGKGATSPGGGGSGYGFPGITGGVPIEIQLP